MSEMQHRAHSRCDECASPFEEDARHHDFEEVEVGNVAVYSARPVHGPGNQKEIENNLGIRLTDVVGIDLEQGEPDHRQGGNRAQQQIHVARIFELAGKPRDENKNRKCNDADVDQAVQPPPPIYGRAFGFGHFPPLNLETSVKIGRYMEMTMPPTTVPSTTIIAGSIAVIRSPTAASTSSS